MATILLIEDDPLMVRMYEKVFKLFNHQVDVATNGEEGLHLAETARHQIILLDVMMPKMNGLDVLKRLKSQPSTKDIPVVILTNSVSDKVVRAAMEMGAKRYIVKSDYDPEEVVKIVEQVIEEPSGETPSAATDEPPEKTG